MACALLNASNVPRAPHVMRTRRQITTRWMHTFVAARVKHTHLDSGTRNTVASIVRIVVVAIGFLVVLQALAIDLATPDLFAGATTTKCWARPTPSSSRRPS